tara:strand:+ start:74 stop:349 length:276 start_codon:yes stop_codon:yes gene_type:complete
MSKSLDSDFEITIQVKWLIQLIFFVFAISGSWYTLNSNIDSNTQEIEHIKESLIEFEQALDERMEPLENEREERLSEMNKSLLDKVLRKEN